MQTKKMAVDQDIGTVAHLNHLGQVRGHRKKSVHFGYNGKPASKVDEKLT